MVICRVETELPRAEANELDVVSQNRLFPRRQVHRILETVHYGVQHARQEEKENRNHEGTN